MSAVDRVAAFLDARAETGDNLDKEVILQLWAEDVPRNLTASDLREVLAEVESLRGLVGRLDLVPFDLDMGGHHVARVRHGVRLTPEQWGVVHSCRDGES